MSNVFHTNWSVCVFALLSSCFCCFSALEIQNIQRASFYDSVSGLHEPPGEWIKPVGLPNTRGFSPEEELAGWGAWQGGLGGRGLGFWVFVFVLLIDLHEPSFHAQFYSPSRQLFERINNSVAAAYTLLLLCVARKHRRAKGLSLPFPVVPFDTQSSNGIVRHWCAQ